MRTRGRVGNKENISNHVGEVWFFTYEKRQEAVVQLQRKHPTARTIPPWVEYGISHLKKIIARCPVAYKHHTACIIPTLQGVDRGQGRQSKPHPQQLKVYDTLLLKDVDAWGRLMPTAKTSVRFNG
jgi:hypothetical protein